MNAVDPNHPPVTADPNPRGPLLDVWHDEHDLFAGQRNYPRYYCGGCGQVAENARANMRHAMECAEATAWSWHCWACATENCRRTTCRRCGKEAR